MKPIQPELITTTSAAQTLEVSFDGFFQLCKDTTKQIVWFGRMRGGYRVRVITKGPQPAARLPYKED